MLRLLHFSDAHIDIVTQGRRDPKTGLPLRVMDFLKALDTIIDAAIMEKVDLVLFSGDAYKDRNPLPTYQREWGRRIMRLSQAGIPCLLLVGNHDISPTVGRANTLHEFETLQVANVRVVSQMSHLLPPDLWNLPLQVLALPWLTRSSLIANLGLSGDELADVSSGIEELVTEWLKEKIEKADATLPLILLAHASVQGAVFGNERSVMLGNDMILPGSIVRDPRLDYVALGHIHKKQNLNEGKQPPIVYPGSIERVDFNEIKDDKYFALVSLEKGKSLVEFRKLAGRKFIDRVLKFKASSDNATFMDALLAELPAGKEMTDAIVRVSVEYPGEWEPFLDETAIRKRCEEALEFHLIRRPLHEARLRLPRNQNWQALSPEELLRVYLQSVKTGAEEIEQVVRLARTIAEGTENEMAGEQQA
jgi:exonuclease SbcD